MSAQRVILFVFALAAWLAVPASRAESPADPLKDLLRRAGMWVERFTDDSTFIVGEERYDQEYRVRDGSGWRTERRSLLSEVVLVRTAEDDARRGYPWVQFRDVIEVDGKALPDHRGRLEHLFRDVSRASYAQARALIEESARFNIGPLVREINVPAFALFFLSRHNQPRFRFDLKGEEAVDGNRAAVVTFRERERPTMIRSPTREDRPSRGTFWIDADTGRVLASLLQVDSERRWVTETEVTYRLDARLDAWLPATMRERHHRGSDAYLDATATYSNYRRFVTSGRMIVPK